VQDALLKALLQWPYSGIPENPGGWLFHVARNGALDVLRRNLSFQTPSDAVALELRRVADITDLDPALVEDDELRMVFMCCHPSLPRDARVALSLKTVGGFSVGEIARAFLAAEPTIAQRLVRAKRLVRDLQLTLELPSAADLTSRLDSVLEVIYLLFNEGYAAHTGEELIRTDLCNEALRLARLVANSPRTTDPAAHAVAVLIAFQGWTRSSRSNASRRCRATTFCLPSRRGFSASSVTRLAPRSPIGSRSSAAAASRSGGFCFAGSSSCSDAARSDNFGDNLRRSEEVRRR
jgi:predicted RNA polymerase sigma factor